MSEPLSSRLLSSTLDQAVVDRLQWHRSDPSVSVLLTTTPAATLMSHDVVRLHRMLDLAHSRLANEASAEHALVLSTLLRDLAVAARRVPAQRGLALFVSERHAEVVRLPMPLPERVVIDPTFATRDLVQSLHATPRFRLLVLSRGSARLLEGTCRGLLEVSTDGFPIAGSRRTRDRAARFGRDRSDERDSSVLANLRSVDTALAARRLSEPLPLVIAGVSRQVAMFRSRSGEADTVIGVIAGSHQRTTPARLAELAAPVIEAHLERHGDATLARLYDGRRRGRTVAGIDAVWTAARRGRVGLLCVEQGFRLPARITSSGLTPAASPEGAGVMDDSVDELIELVLAHGAEVALVEDGRLTTERRVAALVT